VGTAEALGGARQDRLHRAFRILTKVAIPNAENGPTLLPKPSIANCIPCRFRVLATVDLDHQLRLAAGQIGDIWSDWKLSRKLGSVARQKCPYLPLFGRFVRTKATSPLRLRHFNASRHESERSELRFAHPPLAPPFQGGGFCRDRLRPIADIRCSRALRT
jgi:hypothetical protein